MKLSEEQTRVLKHLLTQTTGSYLITGNAGCGKTTLAAHLVSCFLRKRRQVLVMCPTHQAKQQFSNRLGEHKNLNLITVAKFLGQRPIVDKASGRLTFTSGGGTEETDYQLIVVDETSMVGEYELMEIARAAMHSLVVFLGDFAQLRPVMKRQGDAYTRLHTFNLVEQHRNQNAILALCNRVRVGVEYPLQSKGMIRVHRNRRSLVRDFLHALTTAKDPLDVCFLTYRNALVNQVRAMAHRRLYGDAVFVVGQQLRLDQMCAAGYNGSIVSVEQVGRVKTRVIDGETFEVYPLRVINPDTEMTYTIYAAGLSDQARQGALIERLYEASAKAFARDKAAWRDARDELELAEMMVRHSSPFVGTVHKSQGRSIDSVFVDTLDISTGSDKRRLLYVGYSRASRRLHTIVVPPKKRR